MLIGDATFDKGVLPGSDLSRLGGGPPEQESNSSLFSDLMETGFQEPVESIVTSSTSVLKEK